MNSDIENVIQKVSRLPGLGIRSARRIVVHLIKNKDRVFDPLLSSLRFVSDHMKSCPECGNIDTTDGLCSICTDSSRKASAIICIVESISSLWAVEKTSCYNGQYHVLNGLLSSSESRGPDALMLDKLRDRCERNNVREIIIALPATIEGQTTDNYIKNYFKDQPVKISSLAHGIPMGGELDYLDDGTLFAAFDARG